MEPVRLLLNEWLPGNDPRQPGACRERDVEELLAALFAALKVPPIIEVVHRGPNGCVDSRLSRSEP